MADAAFALTSIRVFANFLLSTVRWTPVILRVGRRPVPVEGHGPDGQLPRGHLRPCGEGGGRPTAGGLILTLSCQLCFS